MRGVVRSGWDYFCGVIRRWYILVFAVLFDPIDLYGKLRDAIPQLPENTLPSEIQWLAIGLIWLLATFLTFHDLRMKTIAQEGTFDFPIGDAVRYYRRRSKHGWNERNNDVWPNDLEQRLLDYATTKQLDVWGRPKPRGGFDGNMTHIDAAYWNGPRLPIVDAVLCMDGLAPDRPRDISTIVLSSSDATRYYDIHFNKRQFLNLFPSRSLIFRLLTWLCMRMRCAWADNGHYPLTKKSR